MQVRAIIRAARSVEQRTGELREIQRQLEKAAFYDPLTGLPNRRFLGRWLPEVLAELVTARELLAG